jgi:hypothetical protein
MAQAVSRRPLTANARVRSRVSACGIWGGQSGTGTGFSPSTSVFHCQFHSIGAPLHGKLKKKANHRHHRVAQQASSCGASVASAAGPFSTKRNPYAGLLRVPGGWSSQISRQSVHEGSKVVSATYRPPLPPTRYPWYSLLLESKSTPGP